MERIRKSCSEKRMNIMPKIEDIDKNFKLQTELNKSDIVFCSALKEPFEIYGVTYSEGKYRRMPKSVAEATSEGVTFLHANTAGGRVRFATDSSYIAISVKYGNIGKMPHFALTGSAGFDMYVDSAYNSTFVPPFHVSGGYESLFDFKEKKMREITINFPLYSEVCELYIGLQQECEIKKATPYKYGLPIVYYGHSITQGGCASRPGNAYPAIISRRFNIDHINLGFSGNGKGEQVMADYVASRGMKLFVMDYDHNAPNAEHLQNTHENMFRTVRASHPDIPIILMTTTTKPRYSDGRERRRDIIYTTYKNALENGDKNVYFWDGGKEFAPYDEYGTVEGCHPNDFGFHGIAKSLGDLIEKLI